jgi:uncharacterized protein (TIGR02145 family)
MKRNFIIAAFLILALTSKSQTVTDIDGNAYNTIIIGTQVWMKENLKTINYNDNSSIPLVTGNSEWNKLSTPAYCYYNNDENKYKSTYGTLYNWYCVNTGKLCPTGWHVPTDSEWTTLSKYLGGESVAGGKLKEKGTSHWNSPNTGADNSSGFTALPGGHRLSDGTFNYFGSLGHCWTATDAWNRGLLKDYNFLDRYNDGKFFGLSVRWISDNSANSIKRKYSNELLIYPNPTKDKLYIINDNFKNIVITIYNLQGNQVISRLVDANSIDISNLQNGIYFVNLIISGEVIMKKIVKE